MFNYKSEKMKKRSVFTGLMLLLSATLITVLNGCNKDNDKDNDLYRQASADHATGENLFDDVYRQVDDAAKEGDNELFNGGRVKLLPLDGGCATVTIDPFDTLNWPKTITVDFGDSNCLCNDGKYRRGEIVAIITGRYRDSLTNITITPQNYFVNDNHVEGTKSVMNLGHITDGNMTFAIVVSNGVITKPDGRQFQWDSERTRVWVEGEETSWPQILDDVYEITGTATGITVNGNNFFIEIVNALRIERDCNWIVSGTVNVQPLGKPLRVLDYGDGTCDDQATITVNGVVYEITLP